MLDVSRLSKQFASRESAGHKPRPVLDSLSMSVPENQFVCLLGASGCGKTTLLRIIAGLTEPDSGDILVAGRLVRGPGRDRSMVFQNYGLLPWRTVLGNVELGLEMRGMSRKERRGLCEETIRRVGLTGVERLYPHQISGGMQQRVALARAFCKNPSVLLMDEPFAAVDAQTREMLQDELLKVWSDMRTTVLFVTHSIDEAIYLADRVIVMHSGRISTDVMTLLPRPRTEAQTATPRFNELRLVLRDALRSVQQATAA